MYITFIFDLQLYFNHLDINIIREERYIIHIMHV